MQLKLRRSQRTAGLMGGKVIFSLDARAELTSDERGLVSKYGLGRLSVYDSEARKRLPDKIHALIAQACDEIRLDPREFKIPLRNFEGIETKLASARQLFLSIDSK